MNEKEHPDATQGQSKQRAMQAISTFDVLKKIANSIKVYELQEILSEHQRGGKLINEVQQYMEELFIAGSMAAIRDVKLTQRVECLQAEIAEREKEIQKLKQMLQFNGIAIE